MGKITEAAWKKRSEDTNKKHLQAYSGHNVDYAFIGDSMMERWETTGEAILKEMHNHSSIAILGVGGDKIENLLYRLREKRSVLKKITINKDIRLMIGTNNLESNTEEEIVEGIIQVITTIKAQSSAAIKFILLPYKGEVEREKVDRINAELQKVVIENVFFVDMFFDFTPDHYDDATHFNEGGYRLWSERILS